MGLEGGFKGWDFIRRAMGDMGASIIYRRFMVYIYTFNGFLWTRAFVSGETGWRLVMAKMHRT